MIPRADIRAAFRKRFGDYQPELPAQEDTIRDVERLIRSLPKDQILHNMTVLQVALDALENEVRGKLPS